MNSMKYVLMLSIFSFSLHGAVPTEERLLEGQQSRTFKKFLAVYAGTFFVGTYGYLYWHSEPTPSHLKLLQLALGYSGAGFSMAAATYFASLLWSESGLFQEKQSKKHLPVR